MRNLAQAKKKFRITEAALHSHLRARMQQRGIAREEVERTLNEGWEAMDAKPGTLGKSLVLLYEAEWEGQFYPESMPYLSSVITVGYYFSLFGNARGKEEVGGIVLSL